MNTDRRVPQERPETGTAPGASAPDSPPRPRRHRVVRVVIGVVSALLLAAGGTAYWALDRYVIDHVEIADVAAHEAEVTGTTAKGAGPERTAATPGEPVVTATSYTSDAMSVEIATVVVGSGREMVTYYVADVVVDDATQLRGGFANNQFGRNIIANTSDIAERYDAVLAINGDYYGYRSTGIVIRNGVLFRDKGARTGLAMYVDGTMAVYDETKTSGEKLLADGVWNTVSFGPSLLVNGEVADGVEDVEIDTNIGNHSIQGNQPRTGIGQIDTNHFVFVVVDGRSLGYSRGVTMTEFAQIFRELSATVAYNLDGGGSSTMYFNGDVINDPLGKGDERGTSDILYLG
jgi:exopolysaccharide biosynthesis protein